MGFYRSLLLEEELDSVQDPDNTGVDLDQIADDIVGDGNEAHSEEIDAAVDGVIDDPLDEAFMIMYESEVNYNKILQAVGMQEIQEAARGRELILESGNIKAFFDKVIEIIKRMFDSISKAFRTVLIEMRSMNVGDKQLVSRNAKAIDEGSKKLSKDHSGFKSTVYEYPSVPFDVSKEKTTNDWFLSCQNMMKNGTVDETIVGKDKIETLKKIILHTFVGDFDKKKNVESLNDYQKALVEELRGGEVSNPFANIKPYTAILSADKEGGELTKAYYGVKDSYKSALSEINKAKKAAMESHKKDSDNTSKTNITKVANHFSSIIRYKQNVLNTTFSVFMKNARKKRSQARAIVKACIAASKKDTKSVNDAAIYSGSNMSSIFSNIEFM